MRVISRNPATYRSATYQSALCGIITAQLLINFPVVAIDFNHYRYNYHNYQLNFFTVNSFVINKYAFLKPKLDHLGYTSPHFFPVVIPDTARVRPPIMFVMPLVQTE